MPNQHKPNPPLVMIADAIHKFYNQGLDDKTILQSLKQGRYYDVAKYGLGLKKFRSYRTQLGLQRSRSAGWTVETIRPAMIQLREIYPKAGSREIIRLLLVEHNMPVARSVIKEYFSTYEPDLVRERHIHRFRRKRFWAAGVMDMICVDQHDKWKRFGLRLHTGVDPFIGKIHWLKIWHTNSDPVMIASYYLDSVQGSGHMPLITQSDPGSENFGIAKAHTFLRHWHDPRMKGYLCHRWMKEKKNIHPEISWSQLRRRFTPGFEDILDKGVNEGWYDVGDTVHMLTFRWVFIPWLQVELDAYRIRVNNSKKRRDRNKILPHGVPDHIAEFPGLYGALNFQIQVEPAAIEEARQLYAPPSNAVFNLTPGSFNTIITRGYQFIGTPTITRHSVWQVYRQLVDYVYADLGNEEAESRGWEDEVEMIAAIDQTDMDDYEPLIDTGDQPDGSFYLGGVNRGAGLGLEHEMALAHLEDDDEPEIQGPLWVEGSGPVCVMFSEDEDEEEENEEYILGSGEYMSIAV